MSAEVIGQTNLVLGKKKFTIFLFIFQEAALKFLNFNYLRVVQPQYCIPQKRFENLKWVTTKNVATAFLLLVVINKRVEIQFINIL